MPRLTTKAVIAAASEKTGVKPEYIELIRGTDDSGYYWAGKAGSCFNEMSTYITALSIKPLEYWVEDFESRVNAVLEYAPQDSLNNYIESMDWSVKYDG